MTKAQKRKADKMEIIKDMWSKGCSIEEIGQATGYAPGTISVYLSDAHLRNPDRLENHMEEIEKWWQEGKTLAFISKNLGFSKGRICQIVHKYGLGRRRIDRGEVSVPELIDENTVYAKSKKHIFRCVINGKRYIDVTEMFVG
jgi:hypothetical protein